MTVDTGMHCVKYAAIGDHGSFCTVRFSDGESDFSLFLQGSETIPAARAMVEYFNDFIAPKAKAEPENDPDFDEIEPF